MSQDATGYTEDELLADVRVVEAMLNDLEFCQFPDYRCGDLREPGVGYCQRHLEIMRARTIADTGVTL